MMVLNIKILFFKNSGARFILLLLFAGFFLPVLGQKAIKSKDFFKDELLLNITITTDLTSLVKKKMGDDSLVAGFSCKFPDGTVSEDEVNIFLRGNNRLDVCNIPPIRIRFSHSKKSVFRDLQSLKLVNSCAYNGAYEDLLLKEYLIYKMYNELTKMSFRVRLAKITYVDRENKKGSFTKYAFFIEDIDEVAKRNDCKELNAKSINVDDCEKNQVALVNLFQFMVGNTDWSIPGVHNMKFVFSKKPGLDKPYPVPYDFDYTGLVNAPYAAPPPNLGIDNVTTRVYYGKAQSMEVLNAAIDKFNKKEKDFLKMAEDFEPMHKSAKNEMIRYLKSFYTIIQNPKEVNYYFVDHLRKF